MQLPARILTIVKTLYAQNLTLANGTDPQRRELVMKIAQQVRFEFGSNWGTKRADPGRPLAKDAIAFTPPDGTLLGWDLFNGTTRKPFDNPSSIDISKQVFVAVEPVNHLGVSVPGVPQPPVPPVVVPPTSRFEERLEDLEALTSALFGRITQLEARLAQPLRTSRVAYHDHEVTI